MACTDLTLSLRHAAAVDLSRYRKPDQDLGIVCGAARSPSCSDDGFGDLDIVVAKPRATSRTSSQKMLTPMRSCSISPRGRFLDGARMIPPARGEPGRPDDKRHVVPGRCLMFDRSGCDREVDEDIRLRPLRNALCAPGNHLLPKERPFPYISPILAPGQAHHRRSGRS